MIDMSNELTTTKALEGEYIEAGESEHTFTAEDPISDSMHDALRQRSASAQQYQMDALRGQQQAFGQASSGLGGLGGGLFGFR
jgi:hypothetical protein